MWDKISFVCELCFWLVCNFHRTCVRQEKSGGFVIGIQTKSKRRCIKCGEPCFNAAQFASECRTKHPKALSQTRGDNMSVLFGDQEKEASKVAAGSGHPSPCLGQGAEVIRSTLSL